MTDVLPFFKAWLSHPLRTASVTPSGRALANLITSEIDDTSAPVLELGPGTGVFTAALLRRNIAESQITLVEANPYFAAVVAARFPEARLLQTDAADLSRFNPFGEELGGAAISGLPLLSMPAEKVSAILLAVFSVLRPDAHLYQFTYGPNCPVKKDIRLKLGLTSKRIGTVIANIPPASVYRISRPIH